MIHNFRIPFLGWRSGDKKGSKRLHGLWHAWVSRCAVHSKFALMKVYAVVMHISDTVCINPRKNDWGLTKKRYRKNMPYRWVENHAKLFGKSLTLPIFFWRTQKFPTGPHVSTACACDHLQLFLRWSFADLLQWLSGRKCRDTQSWRDG